MKKILSTTAILLGTTILAAPAFAGDLPSRAELWSLIQKQQQQIEELQAKMTSTEVKVAATGDAVEEIAAAGSGSSAPSWTDKTTIGGYGELHYNGGSKDQIDFHRFVLFFGHEFTEDLRFFAEFELEHALTGEDEDGEVELEQAYLEYDFAEHHTVSAGVMLLPIGILNETHEPNTFYGVERNDVEKKIIPSTWWEAGVGVRGEIAEGFNYNVMYHSGLNVDETTFSIRGGRQKVSNATAKDGAVTGRLSWTGMPGVEIGASAQYQEDITQETDKASAVLLEGHVNASYNVGPGSLGLRALYAQWDIDNATAETLGRDEQYGWYVEPSYKMAIGNAGDLGIFARYEAWDENAGNATDTVYTRTTFGANFWPHPNVVVKVDYQIDDNPTGVSEDDRLNLGLGYQF